MKMEATEDWNEKKRKMRVVYSDIKDIDHVLDIHRKEVIYAHLQKKLNLTREELQRIISTL
jgi:hypothetical protein